MVIPEEFTKTTNGENFLLFDSGSIDPSRIIIFATKSNLSLLDEISYWSIDGTFKIVKEIAGIYQMVTIHALKKGKNLPCVYALLPNKTQESYRRFLEIVSNNLTKDPLYVGLDFEQGIINAVKESYHDIAIHGCYFHFRQNLWRKIQKSGFATDYNNDSKVRIFFRKFAILAFVPLGDVVSAFEFLVKTNDELCKLYKSFVDYFEETYIGCKKRGRGIGRKDSLFPIKMWNVYQRTVDHQPRTSNNVEGWHYGISYTHIHQKLNHILRIIDSIKLEQRNTEILNVRLNTGTCENRRKKAYEELDKRICAILVNYSVDDLGNFFDNLSLIIEY